MCSAHADHEWRDEPRVAIHQGVKAPDDSRISISFRLPRPLVERLRAFVRDNAGKPKYLKLGPFVEEAISAHIDRVEEEIDDGEPVRRPAASRERVVGVINRHR